MEWYWIFALILGSVIVLMLIGMPVAFCFLLVTMAGAYILWGGPVGLQALAVSMWGSVATFNLLPVPMFVLLGEILFRTGIADHAIQATDKWLGRMPGRLGLLTVMVATVFAALNGSSAATTAMLGGTLVPEMLKRGYKKSIAIGCVIGTGGLAMLIPPSSLAVIWASIAEVSVGKILIAQVIPGLMLAFLIAVYVVVRCWLQPSIAPSYEVPPLSLLAKLKDTAIYLLPLAIIMMAVTGIVFLGLATPSEAAAVGALVALLLAIIYKSMTWKLLKEAFIETLKISIMIFLIISAAQAFAQIMSFTGATRDMVELAMSYSLPPIWYIIAMMIVLLFMGCFFSAMPMMLICIPIFLPIVTSLHYDPYWFGVLFLLNIEMGQLTPPYGILLFVMKGVAPKGTTMGEIIRSMLPFLGIDLMALILLIAFPSITTWLPSLMTIK